ncbi:MAG TPA: hypothetical protein VHZ03_28860 [Trebonia sp.]|nr:hypothetical protein [Trebonia sp.]
MPEDSTLAFWKEHREQLRQSESQRALLTNYILVIVAAVSGFIVQQHFVLHTLPLSVLVIVIGLYGALASAKYHERAEYHLSQARALTRALVEGGALSDHGSSLEEYRQVHYLKYPRLHRIRLNRLWTGLHVGVCFYGIMLLIITLLMLGGLQLGLPPRGRQD